MRNRPPSMKPRAGPNAAKPSIIPKGYKEVRTFLNKNRRYKTIMLFRLNDVFGSHLQFKMQQRCSCLNNFLQSLYYCLTNLQCYIPQNNENSCRFCTIIASWPCKLIISYWKLPSNTHTTKYRRTFNIHNHWHNQKGCLPFFTFNFQSGTQRWKHQIYIYILLSFITKPVNYFLVVGCV